MTTSEPSASTSADFGIHAGALKLTEFWADNACVWFAQTEAQFAVKGITSSLTKFYYWVWSLGWSDVAQIVDLIEFPLDESPYQSLKERNTEPHTLNPFQRYQVFMYHLGCQQKTLHLDGEDLLSAPSEPHGAQGWLFPVQRILPQSSASKHQDPLDERGYFWSSQAGC